MKSAVYFGSRALYPDMPVAAKSLFAHSDVDKVYFLTEDDEFPCALPKSIEVINVNGIISELFREDSPNWHTNWTHIGLIRVALSKVFPKLNKILTIDCDTIVVRDVSDLWDIPLHGYYCAAVREPILSGRSGGLYANAGVMMLNLDRIRADGKDDEMIDMLNRQTCYFVAQDAMNHCFRGVIKEISSDYNSSLFTTQTTSPKILHFAGSKRFEWREQPIYKQYKEMPWHDVREEFKDICG